MKVSITYCAKWNYLPRASSLGEEVKENFGATVELIAGAGGVFDIAVDNKMVFSKGKTGRFPEPGEIVGLIKSL